MLTATVADGIVAGIRPLGAHHELLPAPERPPRRPGRRRAARCRGPAARSRSRGGLAEILRERVAGTTAELAVDAATPLATPAAPTVPASWAATLRTVGLRRGGRARADRSPQRRWAPGRSRSTAPLNDIRTWLAGPRHHGPDRERRGGRRASCGRSTGGCSAPRRGYREAATALARGFARAQDFVYIETPALDGLPIGTGDDELDVWQALVDRAGANPALRDAHLPARPSSRRVRRRSCNGSGTRACGQRIDALRAAAGDRLGVFNAGDRTGAIAAPGRHERRRGRRVGAHRRHAPVAARAELRRLARGGGVRRAARRRPAGRRGGVPPGADRRAARAAGEPAARRTRASSYGPCASCPSGAAGCG